MKTKQVLVRSGIAFAAVALAMAEVGVAGASSPAASSPKLTPTSFTADFSAMNQLKSIAKAGKGNVVVLLPDTQSSARYVSFDAPYLTQAFQQAGLSASQFQVQNAQGSTQTMQTQAEAAITNGATVLVIDPLDSGSGAAIESNATQQGVKVIDYDRLTLNGKASNYVSFNNVTVGKLLGKGLTDCVTSWSVTKPQVLEMDGDPTDNNASQFAQGYNSVLNPLYKKKTFAKVGEPGGTWDNQKALTNFEQQYTAHNNINAVLAANDGLGNSVISVLKNNQIPAKKVPVTGQDATLQGLQNILDNYQCMTVYKPIYTEAQAAVAAALYARAGKAVPKSLINGKTNNKQTDVPSILLTPISVTTQNMASTVVKDKFISAASLCSGPHSSACTAAGINPGG
jgi:D-xylose transport system substrate-binding protein